MPSPLIPQIAIKYLEDGRFWRVVLERTGRPVGEGFVGTDETLVGAFRKLVASMERAAEQHFNEINYGRMWATLALQKMKHEEIARYVLGIFHPGNPAYSIEEFRRALGERERWEAGQRDEVKFPNPPPKAESITLHNDAGGSVREKGEPGP